MNNVRIALVGALAAALAACGGTTPAGEPSSQSQAQSTAQEGDASADGRRPGRHPHGPPPEAFAACASKSSGDACTVSIGDEALAGKCVAPPEGAPDARIVCWPDKLPEHAGKGGPGGPGGHGGPPPGPPPAEVFAACDGKAADAACSVTVGGGTIEGTCKVPPPGMNETRLACFPARPPRPEGAPQKR